MPYREFKLPAELCTAAEEKWGQQFEGLEDLLTTVLRELARDDGDRLDAAEQCMVEQRLKELGYL